MKYPCITRNDNEIEMILFNEDTAIILSGIHKGHPHDVYPRFRNRYTNITHEYLSNTWGVVESKEHAEFIKMIVEANGIPCGHRVVNDDCRYFYVIDGCLFFTHREIDVTGGYKQITIPLPPKAELPEAGHNLVFAGGECKEWPQAGDKAEYGSGVIVTVIATDGEYAWVSCRPSDRETPCTVKIAELQKPKTPEEALRNDIKQEIFSSFAIFPELLDKRDTVISISECVSNELIRKYNITPKEA